MHPSLVGLCISLILSGAAQAPGDVWEGRYVFVVKPGVEMRSGPGEDQEKVIGRVHDLTLHVRKVNGDYLSVRSSGVDGWIKKSDVVPYDKATAYFSERIA